jgi:regulator of sigma E protease
LPSSTVESVVSGSPAEMAGLQAGDRILAVDGRPHAGMDRILAAIAGDPDRMTTLQVWRGDLEVAVAVDLRQVPEGTPFGIASVGSERVAVGPAAAIVESARITGRFVVGSIHGLVEIATGQRRLDDLAGPVRIAEISGRTYVDLGLSGLVLLMALLSVNIGIVNLLPIPVLDGGHLVFLGIEAARSRPISPRVLKFCSLGGLVALLVMFVLITGHDLARFDLLNFD